MVMFVAAVVDSGEEDEGKAKGEKGETSRQGDIVLIIHDVQDG